MDSKAGVSAILMRRLPLQTTSEALRSMLLFTKDFLGADFVNNEYADDQGYRSAIARFKSSQAAQEAMAMLDGKPNTANEANMIVEILDASPPLPVVPRRNTLAVVYPRGTISSSSSANSQNSQSNRQSSRYNGTFQDLEGLSPPKTYNHGMQPTNDPDSSSTFHNFYGPTSPIGHPLERQRLSGKSIIAEDTDEETGELLKDPLAYANTHNNNMNQQSRRSTQPALPTAQLANLNLNTSNAPSSNQYNLTSPRTLQSPNAALSPTGMSTMKPNPSYQLSTQHFQRHNYPPVNPADQNPPCNTLYVGNLPIDTSEDELKAMFSKQRGYKRLCFRTKQNGPMCFVEFEDVSFATKALNELYGHPLHNSVKGGIRLSFSKNPLGVRAGQPGGMMGMPSPMSPQGGQAAAMQANGMGAMNGIVAANIGMQSFSTANGPPPGLAVPPGLTTHGSGSSATSSGMASPTGMGIMNASPFGPMSPSMGFPGMKSPGLNGGMVNTGAPAGTWGGGYMGNGYLGDYIGRQV